MTQHTCKFSECPISREEVVEIIQRLTRIEERADAESKRKQAWTITKRYIITTVVALLAISVQWIERHVRVSFRQ
jgi:hypothetical protein